MYRIATEVVSFGKLGENEVLTSKQDMNAENQIRILTWTMFPLWGIVAVNLFLGVAVELIGAMLVGSAQDIRVAIWMFAQVALLILIPVAYFFAVRRIQWNLPPEEHVTDRMNVKPQITDLKR